MTAKQKFGRPKIADPRNEQLNLSFTARELEDIKCRARALGMRPAHFGRYALLNLEGKTNEGTVHHAATANLISHLSRLGNNLNQICKRFHALGECAPDDAEPLLRDIRKLISRLSE